MRHTTSILFCAALLLAGCSSSNTSAADDSVKAPPEYKVKFDTSKGVFVVQVHRDWAPLGSDRFYQLVKSNFYDEARFFRVLPGFVVQWGIAKDPKVTAEWRDKRITDDPVKETNRPGTITFATSGANTRTTQLFINLGANGRLDSMGFSPFGEVIEGMDVVASLYSGYGEQPDQSLIESQGNAYLESAFPNLDYIKTARIQ
jgi:peptidyl-prolyl cis-trans isomerase A (cyclophilin A)